MVGHNRKTALGRQRQNAEGQSSQGCKPVSKTLSKSLKSEHPNSDKKVVHGKHGLEHMLLKCLEQWVSPFLVPRPFNAVPHAGVTSRKLFRR